MTSTDELRKLLAETTPGPWVIAHPYEPSNEGFSIETADDKSIVGACGCCNSPWTDRIKNLDLIALAPNLAAELIALRQSADAMAEALERFVRSPLIANGDSPYSAARIALAAYEATK